MRISVKETDRGYHPRAHLVAVLFDGKNMNEENLHTADEELGKVWGTIKVEGKSAEVCMEGKVELILPDCVKRGQG